MSELGIAPADVLCPPFNLPREPFEYRFKAPRHLPMLQRCRAAPVRASPILLGLTLDCRRNLF
jgi:hypothetical protein